MTISMASGRTQQITVSVTKAVAAAGNYDANDVISEHATTGTDWDLTAVGGRNGGTGYIVKATLLCETSSQAHRCSLYIFNAAPTSVANDGVTNTAVVAADTGKFIGIIDFPAFEDIGGYSQAVATPNNSSNLPLQFTCAAGADDLYGILVTRDAFTNETAGDDYVLAVSTEV